MHELELKFSVPDATRTALKTQIFIKDSQQQVLGAYYFDTANNDLTKAGIALRIRYEASNEARGDWVQTLKTRGDGVAKRVELNVVLPLTGTPADIDLTKLCPDLSKIAEPSVIKQLELMGNLEDLQNNLKIQYYTDVKRQTRLIKKADTQIEVAYDLGKVSNGNFQGKTPIEQSTSAKTCKPINSTPIHEVEFELLSGDPQILIDTAKQWCKRHKLVLSTITKAQRGNLLLTQQKFANPTKSDLDFLTHSLNKNMNQHDFLQAVVNNCLAQILPNASAIAEGSPDGNHVHQIRVGIRRLRTALKMFKHFSSAINPEWRNGLAHTFGLLGEYRDREILKIKTQPMLESLGAPHITWDTDVKVMPIDAVCANDFQLVLLELIAFTHLPQDKGSQKAKPALVKILDKLFSKIAKASSHFASLDTESQHQVRKDLKTLRYVCEFADSLFEDKKHGDKKAKAFIKYLEPAQDVLGEYNDNVVGHAHYQAKAKTDPKALFAVGWFGGQEKASSEKCADSLKTVKKAPKFW